jgi:hypothetical protein
MRSGLSLGLIAVLAAGVWAAGCAEDDDNTGPAADGSTAIDTPEERCDAFCAMTTDLGCEFDPQQCSFFCMDTYRQASFSSGTCVVLFTAFLNCALENQTNCGVPQACLELNDRFFQCAFSGGCPDC